MNGLFINLIGTTKVFNGDLRKVINGVSIGMLQDAEMFNGLSVAFQNRTDTMRGVCIGFVYNGSSIAKGIQIGMHNNTKEIVGIQLGFWNVIENNRYFKKMPIINFHFKKRSANKEIATTDQK